MQHCKLTSLLYSFEKNYNLSYFALYALENVTFTNLDCMRIYSENATYRAWVRKSKCI